MGKSHIKNYKEYITRLKDTFYDINEMVTDDKVQAFIAMYHLDSDWQIIDEDVIQDIRVMILKPKRNVNKKKISSYKDYLIKLKIVFGIPKEMPTTNQIVEFIKEYNLETNWGIEVEDVSKDLEEIVKGKYDEMLRDSSATKQINRLTKSCPPTYSSSVIHKQLVKPIKEENKKKISSYKDYLIKLKIVFGIPKEMPTTNQIMEFIKEYNLETNWGIEVEDVSKDLEEIVKGKYDEMLRGSSATRQINRPTNSCPPTYPSSVIHVIHKQLVEPIKEEKKSPVQKIPKKKDRKKDEPKRNKTIFIDGDNHFDEGQKGIKDVSGDTKILAFFSQEGAKRKFDQKYQGENILSYLVKPGDQAVDNRIKTKAGQLLKKGNQDVIFVSRDKGFKKFANRKQKGKTGNKIHTARSVKESIEKDY